MKLRKFLAAATAVTLLLGVAATPEVGSEIKLALTAHAESGEIPIDAEHFPDANFREYVEKFDTDENGSFSAEEIAAVDTICADTIAGGSGDISSLKGIEYFSALTVLWCDNNQLTSLDLSKNTALEDLICYNNQLTSLNVSGCTLLTYLDCENNQLTKLDVSGCTELEEFGCSDNQLTTLDVGKNTTLTYLDCSDNQLASLDVKNNTALEDLECGSNQLTSLDVSKNIDLEELNCSFNKLTDLDVSNNTKLKDLDCAGSRIVELDIRNNELLSLALKDIDDLKYGMGFMNSWFYVYNYTIEGSSSSYYDREDYGLCVDTSTIVITKDDQYNVSNGVAISPENFPDWAFRGSVTQQDINNDYILSDDEIAATTSLDIDYSFKDDLYSLKGIEYFTALTRFTCFGGHLTEIDVSNNKALETLWCGENQLTELDVSQNTALTYLDCGYNQLTELDVSKNTALTELRCGGNQLTTIDVSKNTALTELSCGGNQLTTLDVSNNTKLNGLFCGNCELTTLDISKNTNITMLYCGGNLFTSLDVSKNTALEELSCTDSLLTTLDVSSNSALSVLYCQNSKLTSLELNKEIVRLLCDHNALKTLDISYCPTLLRACDREEISEKDGVVEYGMYLAIDKTTKLITDPNYVLEEVEAGTADVSGMQNNPNVDVTDMDITFTDDSGKTYSAQVQADGKIMLPSLPAGEYTVTASLENCPSREYTVTVESGKPVELDVELKLYGDINGDGRATTADLSKINEQVQKLSELPDYDNKVADVNGDGKVTTSDLSKINEHVQQLKLMW